MSNYALRLPDSLMKYARVVAKKDKTTLNQLFITAIAEKISALQTEELLESRAMHASEEAYGKVLAKVSSAPTSEEDALD
jgi:hypothetical protein